MTTTITATVTITTTVVVVVHYGEKQIAVVPMSSLSDLGDLADRLSAGDLIVSNYASVEDFDSLPNHPNKDILFNQADDANIAAIVAAAQSWGAGLCYNVEGIAPAEVQTHLEAIYAAVRAIDANIRFTFGTVYNNFLLYYNDYAPFCDNQVIQIQRAWKGTEAGLVDDALADLEGLGNGLYVQICNYTPNVNDEEITAEYVASVYNQLKDKDIVCIWHYFANATHEDLMLDTLDLIGRTG
jgi:hypothetical protein